VFARVDDVSFVEGAFVGCQLRDIDLKLSPVLSHRLFEPLVDHVERVSGRLGISQDAER
jgi:hypothetical protein